MTLKSGLELVPFESVGAVSYLPSIVTMAVSVAICEIFSVKEWWHDVVQVACVITVPSIVFSLFSFHG